MLLASQACLDAERLILSETRSTGKEYLSLLARISALRSAYVFSILNPISLDNELINDAMSAVELSCQCSCLH